MSLSYQPLEPVLVKDPRVIVDNKRVYAILKCGKQTNYKRWSTNSISTSNINFSTPPPSSGIIVDRKITLTLPMRLIITMRVPASDQAAQAPPLEDGYFAPRAFPIHSMLNTIQLTINNCSITQNIGDIIHALLRFNTYNELLAMDYSTTPTALDTYSAYESGSGTNNNVLGLYADKAFLTVQPRGAFAFYRVVENNAVAALPAAAAFTNVVVDMVCTEQLMMSPLYWGASNASGFTNVVSMDWVFNFYNQAANRAFSFARSNVLGNPADENDAIIRVSSAAVKFNEFSADGLPAFSFDVNAPTLNITYISPDGPYAVAPTTPITYPFFTIDKFTRISEPIAIRRDETGVYTQIPTNPEITSNNIQLSSIPRRVYIYVRPSNQDLLSNPSLTDCYYIIKSINIQFGNKTGLFAEADQVKLYEISRKNHCSMSWTEWSGGPVYDEYPAVFTSGDITLPELIGTVGSIFCFEFASDLGVEPSEAPGLGQGSYNLQVRVQIANPNLQMEASLDPDPPLLPIAGNFSWNTVKPELYIVPVYEGSFTITGLGSAMTQTAVISYNDIATAQQSPMYNYKDVQEVNGGNFMSGIKSLVPKLQAVNKFLKDNKVISKAADVASYIPGFVGDAARDVSSIANKFGYGYDGGVVLGGAKMSKAQLQNRLKNR